MSKDENQELNQILENRHNPAGRKAKYAGPKASGGPTIEEAPKDKINRDPLPQLIQWTSYDAYRYLPAGQTTQKLPAGVYEIGHNSAQGLYFLKIPIKTEHLIRFPQTNSIKVVQEIQNFWERESLFRKYGLTYKRGIILWGPPGSGKSCTIQIITQDIIERKGIVVKFTHPDLFIEGMRALRMIEKETPVVILMEDIDSLLESYNESTILNILDGIDEVEKVVFLATTNYPERLGHRIINRPSRFDKRFKIGHPNAESRHLYLKHLIGDKVEVPLDKWVNDTDGFSLAHLKELFVAAIILGDQYQDAINTLSTMRDKVSSEHDEVGNFGFKPKRTYAEQDEVGYGRQ